MNTRKIIASLYHIAYKLDNNGLYYISDKLTNEMIKISQTKGFSFDQLQFGTEYYDANEEFRAAGSKKDLDPEEFQLFQDYLKDLYKKKKIPKIMAPREIGRFLLKSPQDKNKLKNELYGTTNFSQTSAPSSTSGSPQQVLDTTTQANAKKVESGETEGMNDNQLIGGYLWLVAQNLQKHNSDKALDWNDKAKENLSQEAYTKFDKKQEKLYDQYAVWEAEHPDQVAIRDGRKQEVATPDTTSTSPTTPSTGNSSGLDRWVNKAENIYKSWSDKNMPEKSTAPLLIKDVLDYMIKLKNNLTPDKTTDAQAKIDKVQSFIDNIREKKPHTGTVASYSSFTGFGGKQSDVFGGEKLNQKQLDYLAQQESKSY